MEPQAAHAYDPCSSCCSGVGWYWEMSWDCSFASPWAIDYSITPHFCVDFFAWLWLGWSLLTSTFEDFLTRGFCRSRLKLDKQSTGLIACLLCVNHTPNFHGSIASRFPRIQPCRQSGFALLYQLVLLDFDSTFQHWFIRLGSLQNTLLTCLDFSALIVLIWYLAHARSIPCLLDTNLPFGHAEFALWFLPLSSLSDWDCSLPQTLYFSNLFLCRRDSSQRESIFYGVVALPDNNWELRYPLMRFAFGFGVCVLLICVWSGSAGELISGWMHLLDRWGNEMVVHRTSYPSLFFWRMDNTIMNQCASFTMKCLSWVRWVRCVKCEIWSGKTWTSIIRNTEYDFTSWQWTIVTTTAELCEDLCSCQV